MWQWLMPGRQTAESLGRWGEKLAQQEYKKIGFKILTANFFNRRGKQVGEVDFIAQSSTALAFVEVKTRVNEGGKFGSGAEAVNVFKQQKLLKAVKLFLNQHPESAKLQPRIDVCVIEAGLDRTVKSVKILTNAVEDMTDNR